ncbi:MAG: Flp pilus assembly complex ATPase component TadA, partial [Alphaproteobacteria bacterium]|nr:Flp pilus assembly complex ATPase component TadA [Alphaproteobacteria bacterium]
MKNVLSFPDQQHKPRMMLGEWLCGHGALNDDQLRLALHEQKQHPDLIGRILVKLRFVQEAQVLQALSAQTGFPNIALVHALVDEDAIGYWDKDTAQRLSAVGIVLDDNVLSVAMADPLDIRASDAIKRLVPHNYSIRLFIAAPHDVQQFIMRAYGGEENFKHHLSEMEQGLIKPEPETLENHPVIATVEALLAESVASGASDIHLEPEEKSVRIRLRVDGLLKTLGLLHRASWPRLAQRIKVLAGMDIVDSRNIQDGRFHLQISGKSVDFRVSILPTQHGENIVIRILDQARALLPLEQLGFSEEQETMLRRLCLRPNGMLVLTGPVGSGKTTTLYALLQLLDKATRSIRTLEDPIEYQLDGIRQTQVREGFGLSFAEGVRAVLRQDPNVLLIGEIRDADTAQMALRAAMTGSQVFTTLHTQDSFGVFPRLREFGLSPGLMSCNITAAVAQRLVRVLCPECKEMRAPDAQLKSLLSHTIILPNKVGHAVGCAACNGAGYKGRMVISEVLPIDAELDDLIVSGASRTQLFNAARTKGFISMAQDGLMKMAAGLISLESLMAEVDLVQNPG